MRVVLPWVVTVLALGGAAVLRVRRERRERDARAWASATDDLAGPTVGVS